MKKRIISIDIEIISYQNALKKILEKARERTPSYFCFTNAHMTVEAKESTEFQKMVNGSTANFSDGVPVAKACSILYKTPQERIAGMDVFPDLLPLAEKEKLNVFFLGGAPEVLEAIEKRIKTEHPNLNICGIISPPFGQEWENEKYVETINNSDAHLCFVALGCPKQETWMATHSHKVNAALLGVGGAFPVYAGTQKRCPKWMAHNGLEWVFRLYLEPKRLFKRYLTTNSKFIYYLLKQKITGNA